MEKYSEVVGLPLICIEDGKKIGIIKDIVFCPDRKEAKAFLLERKGCEIDKKIILFKDILNIGRDAVVINDIKCVKKLKRAEELGEVRDRGELRGLRIYTKTGEDLGVVQDILFDYKTGSIEGVEISDGLIQDIVQGRKILPLFGRVEFSDESILVDREAIEEMMFTGGGLKRKFLQN